MNENAGTAITFLAGITATGSVFGSVGIPVAVLSGPVGWAILGVAVGGAAVGGGTYLALKDNKDKSE